MDEAAVVNQSGAVIPRQVEQLGRLVDELCDLGRFQSAPIVLGYASVDLEITITSAIEAAQPTIASRGHDLAVVAPLGAVIVECDAARLTQVFANLLVNAAKFTDNRGRIGVPVKRETDWVLVKVRDSGMGIVRLPTSHGQECSAGCLVRTHSSHALT
jgi:two-component system, sensor histidine kinase